MRLEELGRGDDDDVVGGGRCGEKKGEKKCRGLSGRHMPLREKGGVGNKEEECGRGLFAYRGKKDKRAKVLEIVINADSRTSICMFVCV